MKKNIWRLWAQALGEKTGENDKEGKSYDNLGNF